MQRPPDEIARKMVPRWRSLRGTPPIELQPVRLLRSERPHLRDIEETLAAWREDPSTLNAVDVLELSPVTGKTSDVDDAVKYLLKRPLTLASGPRHLIKNYMTANGGFVTEGGRSISQHREEIHRLKALKNSYPRATLIEVEIARHHLSLGQPKQAERAMRSALASYPNDRFVLRSATRLFIQMKEAEQAQFHLKRTNTQTDPWLLSAEIVVGELIGKRTFSPKRSRELLVSLPPGQVTELSASLATLELEAGNFKIARRLFRESAAAPTDNTVAQLRWANERSGIPFDTKLLETPLSFEALAGKAVQERRWTDVMQHTEDWIQDEPFSSRAAVFGCFIASEIVRDFSAAERLASLGILVDPKNAMMLNNRAYSRLNLQDYSGAIDDIEMAYASAPDRPTGICLVATYGCLLYRIGNKEFGNESYALAHAEALKLSETLARSVRIHWYSEELRLGIAGARERADFLRAEIIAKDRSNPYILAAFDAYTSPEIYAEHPHSGHFDQVKRDSNAYILPRRILI